MIVNFITVYFKDSSRKPVQGFYKDFDFFEGFLRINTIGEKQVLYINKEEILSFVLTYKDSK